MLVGGYSTQTVDWLTKGGRQGYVAMNSPDNRTLVVPESLERLKCIPILFVSGADHIIYTTEETKNTFAILSNTHRYERAVIPNTGHLDTWMA
jgi:pimeloyl-ACP methyl ester carboxylesterase